LNCRSPAGLFQGPQKHGVQIADARNGVLN
jgi:hypothetical protein